MKKKYILILAAFVFYALTIFSCESPENPIGTGSTLTAGKGGCPQMTAPFPSYDDGADKPKGLVHDPPDWWCDKYREEKEKGLPLEHPIFQLSQEYPAERPTNIEAPWKELDFRVKAQWKDYLRKVLQYSYEGNIDVDWVVQENKMGRKWYHAPWMHTGPRGREFVHGMTNERCSCKDELNGKKGKVKGCATYPSGNNELCHPSTPIQNWAVSLYNEAGGSFLKEIWDEVQKPDPDIVKFNEAIEKGFPEGTVAIKLLFTSATDNDADYLKNSIRWRADINRIKLRSTANSKSNSNTVNTANNNANVDGNSKELPPELRLLQVDVAVRDGRSKIGWVFGTFVYNDRAPAFLDGFPVPAGAEGWLRLEPVGIMFGNDPGVVRTSLTTNPELSETFLNETIEIAQHLGCDGRLNGAVDNAAASCISCHAFAETPRDLKAIPSLPHSSMRCETPCDTGYWMKNIDPRSEALPGFERTFTDCSGERLAITHGRCTPLPSAGVRNYSLDYSLQLREGIKRYCGWNAERCANWKNLFPPPAQTEAKEITEELQVSRDGVVIMPGPSPDQ